MLATVAARLVSLERALDPDAIEAVIRAKDLFPPLDDEGIGAAFRSAEALKMARPC